LPIYDHFLDVFERDHDRQKIPGRGLIFFLLGSFLAVVFFSLEIAVASILILAFGDSVSHVFGRHFGQIKTPFHPKKFLEGSLFGIILSAIAAGFFVPLAEALVASTVAMILEFPTIRISGHRLDDNLLIPLSAGVVLTIFQEFFPLG
jgi:dolichol kinase